MTALIIIGAILFVIALILFLPVHITACVKDDAKVFLRILFIKIKLFPMKEKPEKKEKKKSGKAAEKKKSEKKEEKKEKEKRNIPELIHSVAEVLSVFLKQFFSTQSELGLSSSWKSRSSALGFSTMKSRSSSILCSSLFCPSCRSGAA